MKNKRSQMDKQAIQWVLFLSLLLIMLLLMPFGEKKLYIYNYTLNCVCLCVIFLLLCSYSNKNGFIFYEPIYLISALYAMMYFIAPIYDILTKSYTWFGYNLWEYGIRATCIELVGYLAFYFIYRCSLVKCINRKEENIEYPTYKTVIQTKIDNSQRPKMLIPFILSMYGICFFASAWYIVKYYGLNIVYILTLGAKGESGLEAIPENIGFVNALSYCLPAIILLYCEYGKSKILKILLIIPVALLQIARGFRYAIIQFVITLMAYYYIRTEKKIKLKTFFIVLVLLMIPVLLMTLFRDSIRAGNGINFSKISLQTLKDGFEAAVWNNLRIYQNFYGMVGVIPESYGYVYGRQMIIGTLAMVIPRVIWPNKISTGAGLGLEILIGEQFRGTGQAYPNLGEYYYAFGVIGVILFMSLYGWWMKYMRVKCMDKSDGILKNIIFSVWLGVNLSLIIRGYTPSNFWYLIFSILPVVGVQLVFPDLKKPNTKTRFYKE